MNEEQTKDLARRWQALMAAGKARWLEGMRIVSEASSGRVIEGCEYSDPQPMLIWYGEGATRAGGGLHDEDVPQGAHPDFNDPATVGCLLAQARERWNAPRAYVASISPKWFCEVPFRTFTGATEAEAIIAALEAAP